jgi:hypothetical protein
MLRLALLASCVEYGVVGEKQSTSPAPAGSDSTTQDSDSDSGHPDTSAGDSAVAAQEACNGIDDDGDGRVDEDFPDADHDGIADCVDDSCTSDVDKARKLDDERSCDSGTVTVTGEIGMELVWAIQNPEDGCRVLVAADLDGDGISELLCPSLTLRVYDGLTGALRAEFEGIQWDSPLAVCDCDDDGALEIWGVDENGYALALDTSGTEVRRSADPLFEIPGAARNFSWTIVPFGAEGEPALVGLDRVASMVDGGTLLEFDDDPSPDYHNVLAIDAEADGEVEFYRDGLRFDAAGRQVATILDMTTASSRWVRPIQADADADAELLWVNEDDWLVSEAGGTEIVSGNTQVFENVGAGLPCTAWDAGRGENIFAIEEQPTFRARDLGGNTLWEVELNDVSAMVACSAFDVDADGIDDLAAGDEWTFRLIGAASGTVLASGDACSKTEAEVPMFVDLDGDGTIEVITHAGHDTCPDQTDREGEAPSDIVAVFRLTGLTADVSSHWPIPDWTGTELNPDLTVPRTQRPSWLTTCASPAQPEVAPVGWNLAPAVVDSCTAGCENGPVSIAVGVENRGPLELDEGTTVAVYDSAGALVSVATIADWVDDWTRSAGVEVTLPLATAQAGITLVAGDDGTGTIALDDPDTSDNTLEWRFNKCD